jgi:hypothetical protein
MASVIRIITSIYFSNGIVLYVQDILCDAVSVLTSYEDGVVMLALLKETVEFTSLMQNGAKQHFFFLWLVDLFYIFFIFLIGINLLAIRTPENVYLYTGYFTMIMSPTKCNTQYICNANVNICFLI